MIEKFEDLGLDQIKMIEEVEGPQQPIDPTQIHTDWLARIDLAIQEKLGVSFTELKSRLSDFTIANAEELTHEFVNIAPLGDYSLLIEDNDGMADFFKNEGHKPEHWKIESIVQTDHKSMPNMVTFRFVNDSVDDGESMTGFVYVSFEGKIKHAFAQGES